MTVVIQGNWYNLRVTLDGRVKPGHGVGGRLQKRVPCLRT
jgi:hypothetical protein